MNQKRNIVFKLLTILVVCFTLLFLLNLASLSFSGNSIFTFPTGHITRTVNFDQKYTIIQGDNLIVNVQDVKEKLFVKSASKDNVVIQYGSVTKTLKPGSVETFVLSKGAVQVNVEKIDSNKRAVVIVKAAKKDISSNFLKPVSKVKPLAQPSSSIFARFLQKFGFGGNNKDLPKEPKIPPKPSERTIDYPVYNLDIKNGIVTTKEQDLLLEILKKKGNTHLLSTTEYGLLVTLGLCKNNQFNSEIGESDLDCGGPCEPCDDYKICRDLNDCKSNKCQLKGADGLAGTRTPYTGICIPLGVPVCRETDTGVEVTDIGSVSNRCVDFDTYIKVSCLGPDVKTYIESDPIDCPPDTFCQNGACVPNERYCNDNDAANDLKFLGIAFDPQNTNRQLGKDYCETNINLQQVNCKGSGVDYSPGVCSDEDVCKDGACISACSENDRENNNYLLGIAKDGNDVELGRDSCASDKRLKQVACSGRGVKYSENDCLPNEFCQDGVCASLCVEDDENDDPYYFGTATDQAGRKLGEDFCVNDWELKQVNCENGEAKYSDPKTCEYNEVCSSGVCISRNVCREPGPDEPHNEDETVFPAVAGGEVKRHIDSCIDTKRVKHVVCRDDTPSVSITECPDPTTCNKGLCGTQPVTHCTDYDWGAIDKNGETKWNQCSWDSPTVKLIANCFVDGSVQYFPEACLDGGICSWPGICVKNKCEDSDGMDTNVVGRVDVSRTVVETGTQQESMYLDHCRIFVDYYDTEIDFTKNYVYEWGCAGEIEDLNGVASEFEYEQSLACAQGYHCEDSYDSDNNFIGSSCVEGERTYECHDSDGEDPSTAGYVTTDRDPGSKWGDGCTSDSRGVYEYVCKPNGYISFKFVECGKYCDWGKCSKGIDTDPNSDPFYSGVVTDINGAIHSDICKNENVVLEYSYNPETGEATETEIPCPENSKCENGACVYIPDSEVFGTCCNKESRQQVFSKPISKEDCYNLGYQQNVGVYFAHDTYDNACSNVVQEDPNSIPSRRGDPIPKPE